MRGGVHICPRQTGINSTIPLRLIKSIKTIETINYINAMVSIIIGTINSK